MSRAEIVALLEKIDNFLYKNAEAYRDAISDKKVHSLHVDADDIADQLKKEMVERGGFEKNGLPDSIKRIIEEEVDEMCENIHKLTDPKLFTENQRRKYITTSRKPATNKKRFTAVFAVRDGRGSGNVFKFITRIKRKAQGPLLQKLNSQITKLNRNRKNKIDKIEAEKFIDIGHIQESAVALQRKAAVENAMYEFGQDTTMTPEARQFVQKLATEVGLSIVRKPGKQKDTLQVKLESQFLNRLYGRTEERKKAGDLNRKLKKAMELFKGDELLEAEGSPSKKERSLAAALNPIAAKITGTRRGSPFFITGNVKKRRKKAGTTVAKIKHKSRVSRGGKYPGSGTPSTAPVASRGEDRPINFLSVIPVINAKITQTVIKNMGEPALENRTGTFASSVRVLNVLKTPKGFPSFEYTYQKDPYQVFENTSGTRFSSNQRDPRPLIDKSIREILSERAIGRFFTRRV